MGTRSYDLVHSSPAPTQRIVNCILNANPKPIPRHKTHGNVTSMDHLRTNTLLI